MPHDACDIGNREEQKLVKPGNSMVYYFFLITKVYFIVPVGKFVLCIILFHQLEVSLTIISGVY